MLFRSGTPAPPDAATTLPVGTPAPVPAAIRPPGPIPFDVHKTALENARVKERDEWKAKHGWAETADKTTYDQAVALAKRFQTDRVGYIRDLIAEAHADPQLSQALRSEAARLLSAGRQAPTMPPPDVEITDGAGNVIGRTYSDTQLAKRDTFIRDQILGTVRQELAPTLETVQSIRDKAAQEQADAAGKQFATAFVGELKTLPHFEAHKAAIGMDVARQAQAYQQAHPHAAVDATEYQSWLEAATLRAYHRVVTAQQDTLSRQAAVRDLTTKSQTNGVVPGRPPVGAPQSSTSGKFSGNDIAAEFARRKLG